MRMAWFILVVAGLLEVGWAVGLKYTHGFTRLWPTVATAAALVASMALLGLGTATMHWLSDTHISRRSKATSGRLGAS